MDPPAAAAFGGRHGLGVVREMPQFREFVDAATGIDAAARAVLVDQAEILIRDFYVHRPLKRAMHAVDPEQRLRLLRHRMGPLTDRQFHAELRDIVTELRDLHTNYVLPEPYRGRIAFLGVLLERYFDDGEPQWMVSKVAEHLVTEPTLVEGVVVTHWNGMPIELAAWRHADREAGSNLPARLARGLENLTLRFLSTSLPPDEDWVDLRYLVAGAPQEARLVWRVFESGEILVGAPDPAGLLEDLRTPLRYQVGLDVRTEAVRRTKKLLFSPAAVQEYKRVEKYEGAAPRATARLSRAGIIPTSRPDDLTARTVDTPSGTFGYLRLWTFHMMDGDIVGYISEVARLVEEELPPEGLIIDARGNGGGYVIAAEFLLQYFTPQVIEPEPTQFLNTPTTQALTAAVPSMVEWNESIAAAVETGAHYSKAIPLSEPATVNLLGQLYHGPVVLITDAFCYSACDMFAAGFQDHAIGPILGVDHNTGAGGANVLGHDDLLDAWPDGPLVALPAGAEMRVSLRRTLRVRSAAGRPIEDLGVVPDEIHEMTGDDLLHGNRDLLARAGEILAAGTVRRLDAEIVGQQGAVFAVLLTTQNVSSVDVYVDGRPQSRHDTAAGSASIGITLESVPAVVRLEGFDGGELVAARRLDLGR